MGQEHQDGDAAVRPNIQVERLSAVSTGHKEHTPSQETLLKEYELCTNDANHLEDMVWITAGIFLTASVAGIGFLSASLPTTAQPSDYVVRALVSVLSILLIVSWRHMAARWYSLQRVMYYRATEIEEELGMYKERYIVNLDAASEGSRVSDSVSAKTVEVITKFRKGYKKPVVRRSIGLVTWIVVLAWLAFLGSQLAGLWTFLLALVSRL